MSVNRVILLGNVGNDPQIRTTQNGKKMASFSLATSEKWKEETKKQWHKVVIYNENIVANVVEKYVNKGSKLYVEGSLQTRKWTDKDGSEKYITEVVLQGFNSKIEIIENRKGESEAQEVNGNIVDGSFDPDIPF